MGLRCGEYGGEKVDVVVLEERHNTASFMDRGVVLLKQQISEGTVNFVDNGKKVSVQHPKIDIGIDALLLLPLRCDVLVLYPEPGRGWGLPLLL